MHIVYPAVVAALLFSVGVYGVLARRNTILVLMSVELMLNAVNLNLVAFDVWLGDRLHSGQVLTLFVIVIAAAEVGVGLAIVLALFRNRKTVDVDLLRDLAEPVDGGVGGADRAAQSATPTLPAPAAAEPALAGAIVGGTPLRNHSRIGGAGRRAEDGQTREDGGATKGGGAAEDGQTAEDGGAMEDGGAIEGGGATEGGGTEGGRATEDGGAIKGGRADEGGQSADDVGRARRGGAL